MTVLVNIIFYKVERNQCSLLVIVRMKMIVVVQEYNYFILIALVNISM